MKPDIANLDLAGLQKQIAKTGEELIALRRSLAESVVSWKLFGFELLPNPTANSLNRDIERHEELLRMLTDGTHHLHK